ncbi:hypothetical protein XENOCAPTIV_000538 [Xenoophorus captivus]|uniref:Uncharacterized protein n=1 Tax=Xenoophorus captivus TaxID=1517983 RepID=A0ABV0RYU0_9TELE
MVVRDDTIGRNKDVSLFLKGSLRLHPPTRPVVPVWDNYLVLTALWSAQFKPLKEVSLECLSKRKQNSSGYGKTRGRTSCFASGTLEARALLFGLRWPHPCHSLPLMLARCGVDDTSEPFCPVQVWKRTSV